MSSVGLYAEDYVGKILIASEGETSRLMNKDGVDDVAKLTNARCTNNNIITVMANSGLPI